MSEKQGKEDLKIIKDKDDTTEKFILKKNRITLIAIGVVVFFVIIALLAVFLSGGFLMSPD